MATFDLYINLRPEIGQPAFVKSATSGAAFQFPKVFREGKLDLRVFYMVPNPTGGFAAPFTLIDGAAYSLKVAIGTPASGGAAPEVLCYESGFAWDAGEGAFIGGILNINTSQMNDALDAASGPEINRTFEAQLSAGSTIEFTAQTQITVRNEVIVASGDLPEDISSTIFGDLLAAALVDVSELDWVRVGDTFEARAAVWRDATLSEALRLECAATTVHGSTGPMSGEKVVTVEGVAGRLYQLDLRVRGLNVLTTYSGGTAFGLQNIGGAHSHPTSNPWWLEVSDPYQKIFLNRADATEDRQPIDYLMSVTAKAGATLTLAFNTTDTGLDAWTSAQYAPGVAPYPAEFDGHFMELAVVNPNIETLVFSDLYDGPPNTRGNGGKLVAVKSDGSGYEHVAPPTSLLYWSEVFGTYSAKNYTRWTPSNASANVSTVIEPKGTGQLLASTPDGTSTGGNNRGDNATDLQTVRSAATQVASGQGAAIVGGEYNEASGQDAVAGGSNNTASGDFSVALGYTNTASGSRALAAGDDNVASANYSTVVGRLGKADLTSQLTVGAGVLAAGDAQASIVPVGASTSNATPTDIASLTLRANTFWGVRLDVVASNAAGTLLARWVISLAIKRVATAGSTAIVGDIEVSPNSANAAGWDCVASADTSAGALKVTGTGGAYSVRWHTRAELSEITFA